MLQNSSSNVEDFSNWIVEGGRSISDVFHVLLCCMFKFQAKQALSFLLFDGAANVRRYTIYIYAMVHGDGVPLNELPA